MSSARVWSLPARDPGEEPPSSRGSLAWAEVQGFARSGAHQGGPTLAAGQRHGVRRVSPLAVSLAPTRSAAGVWIM